MATLKPLYGSGVDLIAAATAALDGLANGSSYCSAVWDNTSNLYDDLLMQVQIFSGASGVSSTGTVVAYVYGGTPDAGATYHYPDGAGAAGTITPVSPTNWRLGTTVNVVANASDYTSEPFSVAACFGGILPVKGGIVLTNSSGAALGSDSGAHHNKVFYTPIQFTSS